MKKINKETEQRFRYIMDLIYAVGVKNKDHSKLKNILIEQIGDFFSYEIKKEREKMAKALRMKKESWKDGMIESGVILDGYNEAVRHFNRVLDSYLKKHDR